MTADERITRYADAIRETMLDAEPVSWDERDVVAAKAAIAVADAELAEIRAALGWDTDDNVLDFVGLDPTNPSHLAAGVTALKAEIKERADERSELLVELEAEQAATAELRERVDGDAWDRLTAERDALSNECLRLTEAMGRYAEEQMAVEAERDQLSAKLDRVRQARAWMNEDGRPFLFVDDVLVALAGES